MTHLLAAAIFAFLPIQDNAERMLRAATADQPLTHQAVVDAPVKDVWAAYTTSKGITSWMVAKGTIELRVGGFMRTSYNKDSTLKGPDVIENQILCFDPERMIAMKCTKTPEKFPFKDAIKNTWAVLYFKPVSPTKTEVVCRMMGFDDSEDSVKLKSFFRSGNQQELDELVKYFKGGGISK